MSTLDSSGLLCLLFGDSLKQRLGEIVAELDLDEGPPAVERPAMIARLDAEILELEHSAEALIVDAEAAGARFSSVFALAIFAFGFSSTYHE